MSAAGRRARTRASGRADGAGEAGRARAPDAAGAADGLGPGSGGSGGGGSAGRDAALPAGRRAVPGLRLLLAAVRLQPARGVLGGRSCRGPQAAGRGSFLAGGRWTRHGERRGQRGPGPDGQV